VLLCLGACQSAYYKTMEKFGYHKRDLLVERVQEARDAQEGAKDQFRSALDRFSAELGVPGGDLRETYDTLNAEFEESEKRADDVRERIASVKEVAGALFEEWETELGQYSSAALRQDSERKLRSTRKQYTQLITAMKKAEAKLDPVLDSFRDQVLYLKHNLNAQAIASLKGELRSIEADVGKLIREMEASISEADAFIQAMARES
jgi:hypothetical protein